MDILAVIQLTADVTLTCATRSTYLEDQYRKLPVLTV